MTNFEKYKEKIKKIFMEKGACGILKFIEGNDAHCIPSCHGCRESIIKWLESEYKEPEVDWSKVKVDTPILVSDNEVEWRKRYFAKYDDEKVFCFYGGTTSWSNNGFMLCGCPYAKLAEGEEE